VAVLHPPWRRASGRPSVAHEGLDDGVEELDTSADLAVVVLVDVGAVGRRSRLAVEAESATYRRAPYGGAPDAHRGTPMVTAATFR